MARNRSQETPEKRKQRLEANAASKQQAAEAAEQAVDDSVRRSIKQHGA